MAYSRTSAVNYALRYGASPNPYFCYFDVYGDTGGDCTNFVSQCLHAGGFDMDFISKFPWWYKKSGVSKNTADSWSLSWSNAHSLYWCLKSRTASNFPGLKGLEVQDILLLEPGDLIFYESMNNVINHSAIITDKSKGLPLITQHTYEAVNVTPYKSNKKKMHFMKIIF